jgi:hypothetical protein
VKQGPIPVSFSNLTANGTQNTETTTALTMTFESPGVSGLTANDISLNANGTGAIQGALSGNGSPSYTLPVSGITQAGSVTVTINKSGYASASKSVNVHRSAVIPFSGSLAVNGDSAIDLIRAAKQANQASVTVTLGPGTEDVQLETQTDLGNGLFLTTSDSPANVVIDGGGRTIHLTNRPTVDGRIIISVETGITLTLRNITFEGFNNNYTGIINVAGGNLIFENGATIRNNLNNSNYASGGGIHMTGGTFTMNGGSISGNVCTHRSVYNGYSLGGGIALFGGTFTMNGGSISGNVADVGKNVYVHGGATFIHNGGYVESN